MQTKVDLFASQPSSEVSSTLDFFAAPDPIAQPVIKPVESQPLATQPVDPFAAVPMNNFDSSDLFGGFTSNADSKPKEPTQNSADDGSSTNLSNLNAKSSIGSKPTAKKDGFQVKSGIWSDSLSRGLIDLNITARKLFFPHYVILPCC